MGITTKFFIGLWIILHCCGAYCVGQNSRNLSLFEAVELAKEQSPAARRASTALKNAGYAYTIFKSRFFPTIRLNGTIPDFSNSIQSTVQPDGTQAFRQRTLSYSNLDLSLEQNIAATGGRFTLNSQLQRLDVLEQTNSISYLSQPLLFNYTQPILRFNALKWDSRIEKLRLKESQQGFPEDMENVAYETTRLFFNLLIAQKNYEVSLRNKNSNDTLYKISKGRFNLGRIGENELLQLELSTITAENQINQAEIDVQVSMQRLLSYLKLPPDYKLTLQTPQELPVVNADSKIALEEAKKHRRSITTFERHRTEAERDVVRAKTENRFTADLNAGFGLTRTDNALIDVYQNLLPQQQVSLGFSIPVVNWGNARSQLLRAKANQELLNLDLEQQMQDFEQEVVLAALQIGLIRKKAEISRKADSIADKRLEISNNRYLAGKISILELNQAITDRVQANINYVQSLSDFWLAYYDLRRKSLYDFESGKVIE